MKYINLYIFVILFISNNNFSLFQNDSDDLSKIQGIWISQEDSNWKLKFEDNCFFDIYGLESEKCIFTISNRSCNKAYTNLNTTFLYGLCEEDLCLEITSLTNTTFSYRDTITGSLHVFNKE